jgi:hypothetical protein
MAIAVPAGQMETVGDSIAIEVESRYAKHVSGAVLDLLVHPYPQNY